MTCIRRLVCRQLHSVGLPHHATYLQSIQDARDLCDCHAKWGELHVDLRGMDERHVHSFNARSSREQVEAYQDAPCYVEVRHCHSARYTRQECVCPHGWGNLHTDKTFTFILADASVMERHQLLVTRCGVRTQMPNRRQPSSMLQHARLACDLTSCPGGCEHTTN